MRWKKKIPKSLKSKKGQTTVEYIILVALVAMLALKMGGTLKEKLNNIFNNQFDQKATQGIEDLWR